MTQPQRLSTAQAPNASGLSSTSKPRRGGQRAIRRFALISVPLAALLLAGCSTAQPGPEEASSGSGSQDDLQSWMVKYAECMQGEGLDYPTPNPDPNGMSEAIDVEAIGGMELFEAADKTCTAKIGAAPAPKGPDGKPMSEEDMMAEALKLTTCLREQGADVPDPTPGGGISLSDDIPEAAFEACGMGMPTATETQ